MISDYLNTMSDIKVSPITHLRLSQAELFVLVRLLKATGIPGMDFTEFHTLADPPPEMLTQTLDTAVKALVARGYLVPLPGAGASQQPTPAYLDPAADQPGWKKVGIPGGVVTLLGICAFPERSLSLTWRTARGVNLLWLHERERPPVAVTSPLPDIYQFTALPDWPAAQHIIGEVLGLKEQQVPRWPLDAGNIRLDMLSHVYKALKQNDAAGALLLLTEGGLPEPTAQSFLDALGSCTALGQLTVTSYGPEPDQQEQQARLVIVVTPFICFLLLPSGASREPIYAVRAVSAAELRAWIAAAWKSGVLNNTREE